MPVPGGVDGVHADSVSASAAAAVIDRVFTVVLPRGDVSVHNRRLFAAFFVSVPMPATLGGVMLHPATWASFCV